MNQESSPTSREGFHLKRTIQSASPEGISLDPAGTGSDGDADRYLGDNDSDSLEELPEDSSL